MQASELFESSTTRLYIESGGDREARPSLGNHFSTGQGDRLIYGVDA